MFLAVDTVERVPEFALQFPIEQTRRFAGGYVYADDAEVIAVRKLARKRGYYTR